MSKLTVLIQNKCPRCHEGDLFTSNNPYKLGEITTMNTHCSHCGLKFEREPGYFYGAMYISYGINIALFTIALITFYLFFSETVSGLTYMLSYIFGTILIFPLIFRLSRAIWIGMLVKYQPQARGEY